MKQDADVIVIGEGIGGVAAGALLAHGGRRVVLLERNAFLGGRCASYEKEGAMEGSIERMEGLAQDRPPSGYGGINTFIPVTSVMDPDLAPLGKQIVNFFGLAPMESKNWQVWVDYHLRSLFSLYPDVQEHLMWYDTSTLGGISQFSGRYYPDIIGIAQSVGQTGEKRPSPVTPVEGLYLVGADVRKDNIGTELAAESALRLADMLS